MSKYVRIYKTDNEFREVYYGDNYKEPWLSRTLENKETNYNKHATTYYMYWGQSGTATAKTLSNVTSAASSDSLVIRTNEPSISSTLPTVDWIHVTATTSSVQYSIDVNNTTSMRSGSVTISGPNGTSIVLNVTQEGNSFYLAFSDTTATTKSLTFNSGDTTTGVIGLSTNLAEINVAKSGIITATTVNKSGDLITGITASFATATTTEDTTGSITISSGGTALTVTVTERGKAYFKWTSTNTSVYANTLDSTGGSNIQVEFQTNYTGLTLSPSTPPEIFNGMPTISGNKFIYSVGAYNVEDSARTGSMNVQSNGSTIGTVNLTQNGPASQHYYYYLINGGNTAATAYTTSVLSRTGATMTVSVSTDAPNNTWVNNHVTIASVDSWITVEDITTTGITLTVDSRAMTCSSSQRTGAIRLVVNDNGITNLLINVRQEAAETYVLDANDTSVDSNGGTVYCLITSTNLTSAELSNLTLYADDSWVSNIAYTGLSGYRYITFYVDSYSDTTRDRQTSVHIEYGDCALDIISVEQERYVPPTPTYYLEFCNTTATTVSETVDATATTADVCINTNYSSLTTGGTNVTSVSTSTTEMSVTFPANESVYNTVSRTATVMGGSKTLTFNITQSTATPYLYWTGGSTSISENCVAAGDMFIEQVDTNCNYTYSSDENWITATSSNNQITVVVDENTGASRTGHVTVSSVGLATPLSISLTIHQAVGQGYIYWGAGTDTFISRSYGSGRQSSLTESYRLVNNTSASITSSSQWVTNPSVSNGTLTFGLQANPGAQRTGEIVLAGSPNGGSATLEIVQSGVPQVRTVIIDMPDEINFNFNQWYTPGYSDGQVTVTFTIQGVDGGNMTMAYQGQCIFGNDTTLYKASGTQYMEWQITNTGSITKNVDVYIGMPTDWHGQVQDGYFNGSGTKNANEGGCNLGGGHYTVPAGNIGDTWHVITNTDTINIDFDPD